MATTSKAISSPTDLTDSLLHGNIKRVFVGLVCGLLAGIVMLGITVVFTPEGVSKLWWLQLAASVFYGGNAFSFEAAPSIFAVGFGVHMFFSALCGVIMGKMTTTRSYGKLMIYGLVLGGLCWLASNMFGPDLFNVQGLEAVGEWMRVGLFVPFAVILGIFLAAASRALNI